MEIPVLVRSLKSSILSSTSFQPGKTFWWVVSAAVEQSRHKANMVAQGDGKYGPWGWPHDPSKPKKKIGFQGTHFGLTPSLPKAILTNWLTRATIACRRHLIISWEVFECALCLFYKKVSTFFRWSWRKRMSPNLLYSTKHCFCLLAWHS